MGCLLMLIISAIFFPGFITFVIEIIVNAIPVIIQLLPDIIELIGIIISAIGEIITAIIHMFPSLLDYVKENPFISLGAVVAVVVIAVVISKK